MRGQCSWPYSSLHPVQSSIFSMRDVTASGRQRESDLKDWASERAYQGSK